MSKKVLLSEDAKKELIKGVDVLANAVKVTLGPQGRNVMLEKPFGPPSITKDGISVAREIMIPDRIQNMAASFVRSAASKTNDKAGDGTTTATVLTQAIVSKGFELIKKGENPVQVQRGINKGAEEVIKILKENAVEIGDNEKALKQIAYISANNDKSIGDLIGEAFSKVGKEGIISVEQSKTTETYVDLAGGMKVESGYFHPYLVNDTKRGEVFLEDVVVLISEDTITTTKQLIRAMDASIGSHKALLVIAEVQGQALETLLINKIENKASIGIIKPPGFGERRQALLEDIAVATGAKVLAKAKGKHLGSMNVKDLGYCSTVRSDFHDTVISGVQGTDEMINFRVEELEALKKIAENDYESKKLDERIASLKGGVGVIYVGAPTEEEMKEKMDRVEDAKNATKAALEEGIVCGGGIALLQATTKLKVEDYDKEYQPGMGIIYDSLIIPLVTILENAGLEIGDFSKNWEGRKSENFGFDAKNFSYVENMIEAGIIDPVKVTRIALENAASAGGMILTTECTVTTTLEGQPKQE